MLLLDFLHSPGMLFLGLLRCCYPLATRFTASVYALARTIALCSYDILDFVLLLDQLRCALVLLDILY